MIELKNINKSFNGHDVLKNISFSVAEGETLVLLGTSGSGKTTLLRLVNRLLSPTSGSVFIHDKNIAEQQPELVRRQIGYVLQGYGLFPHYTVAQNIGIVPGLLKWPQQKTDARVAELLQKLQLPYERYAHVYPDALSGGQKQRVGLARALAANPPLLLMDEPFGALDPLTRADIVKAFKQLDELKQKTVILVTHDVSEAMQLGDKIILLDKGNIVQSGKPIEFVTKPANEFVKQFFSKESFYAMLNNTTLYDHWSTLQTVSSAEETDLKDDNTLWETLEWLLEHQRPARVHHSKGNEVRSVDLQQWGSIFETKYTQ